MFNKYFYLYFFLSVAFYCNSQTFEDALRYSSFYHEGTSRFNSMGGAFGALGGDLSADNDGALGRVFDAKRRINKAMAVLGKFAGDAIWAVIGEDMGLRKFAQRQATSGRPITVNEVKGRETSGLDILADHYKI